LVFLSFLIIPSLARSVSLPFGVFFGGAFVWDHMDVGPHLGFSVWFSDYRAGWGWKLVGGDMILHFVLQVV